MSRFCIVSNNALCQMVCHGDLSDFRAFIDEHEIPILGIEDRKHLRPELHGLPVLQGYLGPMYDGPDCFRYEDQSSYNVLST